MNGIKGMAKIAMAFRTSDIDILFFLIMNEHVREDEVFPVTFFCR
jgi:hypothetical protein